MKIRNILQLLLYVLLIQSLLIASVSFAQKFGEISETEWMIAPPAECFDDGVMVIFDKGELDVSIITGLSMVRHVRMLVINKEAADEALTIEIPYYKDDKIRKLKAHTILPDGTKIKVEDKFKKKVSSVRFQSFTFPAVENGVIVEYTYEHEHNRYFNISPWYFQNDYYTQLSEFSLIINGGFKFDVAYVNLPYKNKEPEREEGTQGGVGYTKFTWKLEDIKPFEEEPYSCAELNYLTAIYVFLSGYQDADLTADWDELGEGLDESISEFLDKEDMIKELSDSICRGVIDRQDKIKRLYNYVRNEIRTKENIYDLLYSSDLEDMLIEKSGNINEKNCLLTALLEAQEIEAHPLYIGTRNYAKFNALIHQLYQFNRLICFIPAEPDTLILDAAYRSTPFPYMPAEDNVYNGLLLNGENSDVIRFKSADRESESKLLTSITVNAEGAAVCSTHVKLCGEYTSQYDEYYDGTMDVAEITDDIIENIELDYELESQTVNLYPEDDSIAIDLVINIAEFGEFLGDNLIIPSLVIPCNNPFSEENRQNPVDFQFDFKVSRETTITIPSGYEIVEVPKTQYLSIQGGSYSKSIQSGASMAKMTTNFSIYTPYFENAQYGELRNLFTQMEEINDDQFILAPLQEGSDE